MDGTNGRGSLFHRLVADRQSSLYLEHRNDLRGSGLTDETIEVQRILSVPKPLIKPLLGFLMPGLESAMLIPFASPAGGFWDHIRVKVFPSLRDANGHSVKYL